MTSDPNTVKAIFLSAIDRSTARERDSYLDEACSGDMELRQRVVALLKAHAESGSFPDFAALADSDSGSGTEAMARTPDDVTVTRSDSTNTGGDSILAFLSPAKMPENLGRLGDYEIQSVIGQGGMGVVLKAVDERLNRIVAVKILAPQYAANAAARKRFIREARNIAAVVHEHVVAVHFVSGENDPHPYLVMQLVQGVSLQERLDRTGPLELKEILRIGLQTARGLAAAHAQGLVHRDIKPANILLENGVERVKITDFGLARAVDDASVTQQGAIAGTPMFMSPEQAGGERVDARSDLFSLGSVLYMLCTGRPPFRGGETLAVMMKVIEDTPTPVREINADIPDWLEAIIAKLQAKKPDDRFQSAKELAELLEQHLAHLQQPSKVPMPAKVEVPAAKPAEAMPEERPWKQLLDATDSFKRLLQHGLLLLALAFACFGVVALFSLGGNVLAASAMVVAAVVLVFGCSVVRQKWIVPYKGRFIRFENSAITGEKLFVDGQKVARGGIAIEQEFYAAIPEGPGAGDQLRVLAYAGFFSFRCQVFVREAMLSPVASAEKPAPGRLARARARRRLLAAIPILAGIFVIAAVWFGRPFWLFATNEGEIDFPSDDMAWQFVIVQSPNNAGAGATVPLEDSVRLPPGTYQIGGLPRNGMVPSTWRINSSRVVSGYVSQRSGTTFTVELKRGERIRVTVLGSQSIGIGSAPKKSDKDILQGTWVIDPAVAGSAEAAGETVPPEEAKQIRLVFTGGQVRFHMPGGKVEGGTFKLDSAVNPKEIDVIDMNSQYGLLGIYSLYGDTRLTVCMGQEKDRPKEFKSNAGTTQWLMTLRKAPAQPTSDKDTLQGAWQAVEFEEHGNPPHPLGVISWNFTFVGDKARLKGVSKATGSPVTFVDLDGAFVSEPNVTPKRFRLVAPADNKSVMQMVGIYELLPDNRLRLCYFLHESPPATLSYPAAFATKAGSAVKMMTLKRAPAQAPGWAQLFNGKDLSGWKPSPDGKGGWSVKDEWLHGEFGTITSEREYENFRLRAQVRVQAAAARMGDAVGMAFLDIRVDESKGPVAPFDRARVALDNPGSFSCGNVRQMTQSAAPGQTYSLDVIVDGPNLVANVDGKKVVDFVLPEGFPSRGKIILEAGSIIDIRNIEIKDLSPEPPGWVQLFNGKDLTGWTSKNSPFGIWKVENGELIGQGNQARLRTERDNFADFHLRVEAKHVTGAGNLVIREQPDTAVKGYAIFIGNTPGFQTGALTTYLGKAAGHPTHPQEKALTKPDEWFTLEVIAKGNRLQVLVNGVRTADVEDANKNFAEGFIRLGITGQDGELRIRKIEIRELPTAYSHGQTVAGWGEVIDPNRDCKFAVTNEELTITVPGGHHNLHANAPFQNLIAPRVLQKVIGDFDVQVRVQPFIRPKPNTASTGKNSYVGAGLLLWQDEKNFVRFFRAANGESGHLVASVEIFRDGKAPVWKDIEIPDEAIYLRVERSADRCRFAYGADGVKWTEISDIFPQINDGPLDVGIAAANSTTATHIAEFRNFAITKLAPGSAVTAGTDEDKLQGKWGVVSIESEGEKFEMPGDPLYEEFKVLMDFSGDKLRQQAGRNNALLRKLLPEIDGVFHVNPRATPKQISLLIPRANYSCFGIYRLDGDTLTICLSAKREKELNFPTEFTGKKGSGTWLMVLRREQLDQSKEGFISLFNGKDLTGWKTHPDQPGDWKVEKGVLIGRGPRSHLFSERGDYENFHLRVEAKINDAGDSGVYFRTEYGLGWRNLNPKGYEAQIVPPSSQELFKTGSIFNIMRSKVDVTKPDTWFTMEIIAIGNHIVVKVDGEVTADFVDPAATYKKGNFALQVERPPNTVVEFRKIEIKELPTSPLEVPRRAADVIPFMAGNWKVDMEMVEPKLPPDKAKAIGYQVSDFVAGGKFLRVRAATEDGSTAAFVLYSYDADRDVLTFRGVWSNGNADGNVLGRFNPDDRSVLWLKRLENGNQFVHQLKFVDGNTITSRSYTQDETGKAISDVGITFTRVPGPVTLPNLSADPKHSKEMKVLDRLIGEWQSEVTVKEGTPPVKPKTETMRTKAQPILGGRFIEEIDTIEPENTSHYSLFWFDEAAKQYRFWFFLSAGYFFEGTGTWNEAAKTLTWNSAGSMLQGQWVFKGDNQRELQHLVKDKDGKSLFEATGTSRRIESGFVPLFNGKDLAGWKTHPDQPGDWKVEDGQLKASGRESHLFTERAEFENFHLRVEAIITDPGVFGVYYRSGFNLVKKDDAPRHPPGFVAGFSVGDPVPFERFRDWFKPNEWFTLEVIASGNHRIEKYNGKIIVDVNDQEPKFHKGHIALRQLGSQFTTFFRKVEIKELPATPPAPQPVKIKVFDPSKDKTATEVGITQDQGGWKIESKQKQDIVLFIVPSQSLKPDGRLVLRGQSKAMPGADGKVDSHLLWRRQNGNFGATGLVPVVTKNDWQPWTNAITLDGDVSVIEVGLRFAGPGTVWLKDLELVQEPVAP